MLRTQYSDNSWCMNCFRKIAEAFDSWDLKSVFTALIIIGVCLIGFFFYYSDVRDGFRGADKKAFKGRTNATIFSIKPIDKIKQGKYKGTRIEVDGYEVSYSYIVNGQTYQDIDFIPLNAGNRKFLEQLLDAKSNHTIVVAFDESYPGKSVLIESR
jgi:hypothetical protein